MKLLGINFGGSKQVETPIQTQDNNYYNFTSPFLKVGSGNLALPYVTPQYTGVGGYVRYGQDNLFPNLLRQLYHTSPLHSSIINYISNAVIGGGYIIENVGETGKEKVELYQFENLIKLKSLVKKITKDVIMFNSSIFLITNDSTGKAKHLKRIPQDEIRWDESRSKFTYNKDFSRGAVNQITYDEYTIGKPNHQGILVFRTDDEDNLYPIPSYASANNWIFLDGESSFLHKSNILNAIFPSTVFKFPKKPASAEEFAEYKKILESAKGAQQAGRAIAFFETGIEQLPVIETIATNDNDKLFTQTDDRIDSKICQAHSIDPILMGIRVSGSLGNGSDIKQTYPIFEKNVIMPLRSQVEEIVQMLFMIFVQKGSFKINNYQIIDTTITEIKK